jgi:hypothetical protein
MHEYVRRANLGEGFGYGFAAFGVLGMAIGISAWHEDKGLAAAWTAGFGAGTAAFAASLAASRDTRVDVLTTLIPFDSGVAFLGPAVARDPGPIPRFSSASASGAFFVVALFDSINALTRQSKLSTLRADRDRLDVGDLPSRELSSAEHDFLGTHVPFGPGMQALPLGVGGGLALVPAFDSRHYSKEEQTYSVVVGSLLGLDSLILALAVNLVPSYTKNLNAAGLSLMASPTNSGLRYQF